MASERVEVFSDARNMVGESPVWHPEEAALYWVDIPRRNIHRRETAVAREQVWTLPEAVGCIAPAQDGGWICGMESGVFHALLLSNGTVQIEKLAGVLHAIPAMRFNDGRNDRQGRFRAGTMAFDTSHPRPVGAFYSMQKGPRLDRLMQGFRVPNGLAFSPDGKTMYLSDSHAEVRKVWAFDYDLELGVPSNRRLFVDMNLFPGRPDGAAVDQDGCYWTCANDAGRVHRFTPAGRLDRSIALPIKKPAMCAFGGSDLDCLFVTSIRPEGVSLSDQPMAGGVFSVETGTKGIAEVGFEVGIEQ